MGNYVSLEDELLVKRIREMEREREREIMEREIMREKKIIEEREQERKREEENDKKMIINLVDAHNENLKLFHCSYNYNFREHHGQYYFNDVNGKEKRIIHIVSILHGSNDNSMYPIDINSVYYFRMNIDNNDFKYLLENEIINLIKENGCSINTNKMELKLSLSEINGVIIKIPIDEVKDIKNRIIICNKNPENYKKRINQNFELNDIFNKCEQENPTVV